MMVGIGFLHSVLSNAIDWAVQCDDRGAHLGIDVRWTGRLTS